MIPIQSTNSSAAKGGSGPSRTRPRGYHTWNSQCVRGRGPLAVAKAKEAVSEVVKQMETQSLPVTQVRAAVEAGILAA